MPRGYATIPSGRTRVNLFPCAPFRRDNFYRKASQTLQEQEQQRSLQKPSFPELTSSAEGNKIESLIALSEAFQLLGIDVQCTISDQAALTSSLVSSRTCSKQALKKLAAVLKPAAIKKLKSGEDFDDALGDAHLQHLLHRLQSKAVADFERSCGTIQLQTPLLLPASVQVSCQHLISENS